MQEAERTRKLTKFGSVKYVFSPRPHAGDARDPPRRDRADPAPGAGTLLDLSLKPLPVEAGPRRLDRGEVREGPGAQRLHRRLKGPPRGVSS